MIAIIDLSGGFGNQLFQYTLALELQKIGYEVHIYDQTNLDYFDKKIKGIKKTNNKKIFTIQKLKRFSYIENKYMKSYFNSLDIINEIKTNKSLISFFNGYWQNFNLVKNNLNEIRNLIENQTSLRFSNKIKTGKTLIHVRRNDYLDLGEDLGIEYYSKAISYINRTKGESSFHIFTDDYEWVKSQNIFSDAEYIETKKSNLRDKDLVFKTIFKMSNYENYITANSTFSWWAATLNQSQNLIKIRPEPYFKIEDGTRNLFDNSWIDIRRN